MNPKQTCSRRAALKGLTTFAASVAAFGTTSIPAVGAMPRGTSSLPKTPAGIQADIWKAVFQTPLIDTHEHLVEESYRLDGPKPGRVPCDDWALLFSHYLDSDLAVAGMPEADLDRFLAPGVDPNEKWRLLEPHWPAVKNTGYAQAVRLAIRELYGVQDISAATVAKIQAGYERMRKPGFYRHILCDVAGIESCQVNSLMGQPFQESALPDLLMQDLSIVGMFAGPNVRQYAPASGIEVKGLADWHRVIRWWFDRYSTYAVAVKSQNAYSRDIDYERVSPEQAAPIFRKVLSREPVTDIERKTLEDHLFWQAVDEATQHNLPVKLHTGYYAGHNSMPLARLRANAGSACELCRRSPDTRFVFMHLCYPYYEELLATAKQWSGATVDMCWAWIINPVAAKNYLKKHLVTAPATKLLLFGGDYIPVEPVVGHALLARRGLALALSELVQEGWLSLADAVDLVGMLMNGNARRIFRLAEKTDALRKAPWAK